MGIGDFFEKAGGSILGGAASAAIGYASAKKLQEDAQQFQTSFYRKRYQRTMADMRAAGLNPILAYRQGPGSTTGAGIASSGAGGAFASGASVGQQERQAGAAETQATSAKKLRNEQVNTELHKQGTLNATAQMLLSQRDVAAADAHLRQQLFPQAEANARFDRSHPRVMREARRASLIGGAGSSYMQPLSQLLQGIGSARGLIPYRQAPGRHSPYWPQY